MLISAGTIAAVFQGLHARFLRAANNVAVPDSGRLIVADQGVSRDDKYPITGLLGDLVPLTDELYYADVYSMVVNARAVDFAMGFRVRQRDLADDRVGVYNVSVDNLAVLGATHPFRNIAATLVAGFTTAWGPEVTTTGAMVYDDGHIWPGGQVWDNLDNVPLSPAYFDLLCLHLEQRLGPNAQPMGLSPKLLVVGPTLRATAESIVLIQHLAGGGDNRRYKRCDLLVLPRIRGNEWFVIDDDPYNVAAGPSMAPIISDVNLPGRGGEKGTEPSPGIKPILLDVRSALATASQTAPEADSVFDRNEYRFNAKITYTLTHIAPWLIQASKGTSEDVTTTTTSGG